MVKIEKKKKEIALKQEKISKKRKKSSIEENPNVEIGSR